jgi:hypothetical protein
MMNFEKPKQNLQTESFHPADLVAETKILIETYHQLFQDVVSDIRKFEQQKVFSKSIFDESVMENPGDHIDNPELSIEDLDKKIQKLILEKKNLLDHIERLAEQNRQLEKQLSVDPRLN